MLFRSIEESRRKLQFDLYYIKHMSFLLDLFIMMKTAKTILFGRERAEKKEQVPATPAAVEEIKTETLFFNPKQEVESGKPAVKKATG